MTRTPELLDLNAHRTVSIQLMTISGSGSRTLPIELVRSAAAFAESQGWERHPILAQVGISPALLTQGRARVTEEQASQILRALWRLTDDELLGMGAHPLPRGSFKLICYGLISADNLDGALQRASSFSAAIPAMPQLETASQHGEVTVSWDPLDIANDHDHLWTFAGIALVHRLMAWALAQPVNLSRVELPFPQPRSTEMPDLVFGAPQVYDSAKPAIVFSTRLLQAPLVRTPEELEIFIANSPAGLLARPKSAPSTSARVRRLVQQGLHKGRRVESAEIAERLAISQQTLRRWLADDDTSLRQLRDTEIRDAAITALVQGDESISEISTRLGFSEPSAFTRAFRRWTGSPPSAYQGRAN